MIVFPSRSIKFLLLIISFTLLLSACSGSGGGGGAPSSTHTVTLTWNPNHEKGVNSAGGGYQISIGGQPVPIDVPFNAASGVTPTSKVVTLSAGTYTATISAYAALDANGGSTGSTSANSSSITIKVP